MALEQVVDLGFDARWAAWQKRGALQDRTAIARMKMLLALLAAGLAVAGCYVALLP